MWRRITQWFWLIRTFPTILIWLKAKCILPCREWRTLPVRLPKFRKAANMTRLTGRSWRRWLGNIPGEARLISAPSPHSRRCMSGWKMFCAPPSACRLMTRLKRLFPKSPGPAALKWRKPKTSSGPTVPLPIILFMKIKKIIGTRKSVLKRTGCILKFSLRFSFWKRRTASATRCMKSCGKKLMNLTAPIKAILTPATVWSGKRPGWNGKFAKSTAKE